ncbi:probable methyltransferase TARBP1, partial [Chrysoperla carnea]|uniref:probable methyltransferase TARBP1 n=1 Tax=Chrysoperla carnea TaxID=189513 RepID=UPI001D05F2CF
FISYKILPKYLQCLETFDKTDQNLYNNELREIIIEQFQKTRNYLHLCCVADYLITDPRKNDRSVVEQAWFWEMIQKGLSDSYDSNCRKSSLFLLKFSLNINEFSSKIIKYDKKHDKKIWETFIFLYETLDEKQSHIILPALNSLACLTELHSTWQVIIYRRLLSHDSSIIQRYGIDQIFKLEKLSLNIFNDLIVKLNDMYLYQKSDKNINLMSFFKHLKDGKLLDAFLLECTKIQWQAVPFFHVCCALLEAGPTSFEDSNIHEETIQKLIDISDKVLNLYIRNASQCLLLQYLQSFNKITIELLNQIQYLIIKCSINMNSKLWTNTVKWLKRNDINFDIDKINSSKILLLLNGANYIKNDDLLKLFENKLNEFINISTRHSIEDHLNESFIFITDMYEEIDTSNDIELKQEISSLVQKSSAHLFGFITRSINENDHLEITDIDNYLRLCQLLLKNFTDVKLISKCRESLINESISIELKYFWLSILKILIENTQSYPEYICDVQKILRTLPSISSHKTNPNRQIISCYYKILNSLEVICIKNFKEIDDSSLKQIQTHILESLECGGRESVSVTMELIQLILPKLLLIQNDIQRLMSVCWNETAQLKKCDLFWNAMLKFIQAFFRHELLLHENLRLDIFHYGNMILENGQQMRGLAKLLYDELFILILKNVDDYFVIESLKPFIIKGLIFGTNLRKDERIEFETTEIIKNLEHVHILSSVENKYVWDQLVRVRSIEIVSMILKSKHQSKLIDEFLNLLINEYRTNNRCRYYANSNTHLFKNRLLQSMLLLQPLLDQEAQNLKLFEFVCDILKIESPQPSIRYQLEWLLVLIIHHDCQLIENLQSRIQEFSLLRMSSLISIVSVVYHLTLLNPMKFLPYANFIILPLAMMSNFNVRLYAQVTFLWILEKLEQQTKYKTIYQSLQQALNPSNVVCKPYEKLKNDFFLTKFDPINHLTIETIYHHLPRLTLLPDEALDLKYFETSLFKNFKNDTDILNSCTSISWGTKEVDAVSESSENDLQKIYQKKTIPVKIATSELDVMDTTQKFHKNCGNLIVIASLVERAPNLGGLSRTCEIFGVERYVINNLRQAESKEFQNLSVSSEKWLDIQDVPVNELAEYLFEMKRNGYTIVGCEQSTNSVQLTEFKFPKRTVLLLGNEKEGIPPNLLSIVDVCVEIPQCGVIRSLNVHVSGAITIWQYACQHLFYKK